MTLPPLLIQCDCRQRVVKPARWVRYALLRSITSSGCGLSHTRRDHYGSWYLRT
jgi:hypothetical protein